MLNWKVTMAVALREINLLWEMNEITFYWHQHFESDSAGPLKSSKAAINVVAAIKFSLHSSLLSLGPLSHCLHMGRFRAICFVQHFKMKTATSLSITTAAVEESR